MKTYIPYVQKVQTFAKRTRRSKLWTWIKDNSWFCLAQALCLSLTPFILFFSYMARGYHAIGGEVIIIFAPLLYRGFKWVIQYDENRENEL